uniref:ExoV-like protein n=1 Tax=Caulobacter sp. (strain K31) TaxID=366602 RepID=B0T440_CAUSK
MRLIYYKGRNPNFGDDMNAVLWPSLTPSLFNQDGEDQDGFLGIGTIIGMKTPPVRTLHVFSSGVGYDPTTGDGTPRKFWCVRGPMSARRLGLEPDVALTDGALLSPLLWSDQGVTRDRVGVVPHWESVLAGGWSEACAQADFDLIDPMRAPEPVIRAIMGKRLILTESLHGAILADTYGVPWLPFAISGNFSAFKWFDWTASVGVSPRFRMLPPPDARALLHFGRPRWGRFGDDVVFDEAAAHHDFETRTAPVAPAASPGLKQTLAAQAKKILSAGPGRHMLGYGPARTAEALQALAKEPAQASADSRRAALRQALLDRLAALAREQGAEPAF